MHIEREGSQDEYCTSSVVAINEDADYQTTLHSNKRQSVKMVNLQHTSLRDIEQVSSALGCVVEIRMFCFVRHEDELHNIQSLHETIRGMG